jgi:hypothetical protein
MPSVSPTTQRQMIKRSRVPAPQLARGPHEPGAGDGCRAPASSCRSSGRQMPWKPRAAAGPMLIYDLDRAR